MTFDDKLAIGTNWQGTDLWGTYYDGIEILNKKNFDKAISIFNQLIEEAYLNDVVNLWKGRYSNFQKFWAPRSLGNRGICYAYKKEYNAAIEDFSVVLELVPKNIKALHNRAHTRLISQDLKNAIKDLDKIIKLIGSVSLHDPLIEYLIKSHFKRGMAYREIGEIFKSAEDLSRYNFLLNKLS